MKSILSISILVISMATTATKSCEINWEILTNPITVGETVELECLIGNSSTCPGIPRWEGGPGNQLITIGPTIFDQEKYNIRTSTGKYILIIRQTTKEDLDSNYVCHVRFDSYEAHFKDKKPVYRLMHNEPQSIKEDIRIFANMSAVPINHTDALPHWTRHPINNSEKSEELLDKTKFLEATRDDVISLTIKNVTKQDVNMTYQLTYGDTIFSSDVVVKHSLEFDVVQDEKEPEENISGNGRYAWFSILLILIPVIAIVKYRKRIQEFFKQVKYHTQHNLDK